MTAATLTRWYDSRRGMYRTLAEECGSVAELMFKIEVYGSKWTEWDWVMFFYYLDWTANGPLDEKPLRISTWNPLYGWKDSDVEDGEPEKSLLEDVFRTLDEGKELDSVFSNKTVIMHFIEWLKQTNESSPGLLRVLAHVFKKFPEMWKMNWMFIRHKGKNKKQARTHRLAEYVFSPTSRPDAYFASDALLSDFIYKYYSESSGRDCKCPG